MLGRNVRLFALITNTLAKDKQLEDGWRKFARPISSRNLANQVEDDVVDALITAVRTAYPRLSHRYYALKARWLGLERLEYWDRNAPLPEGSDKRVPWSEAKVIVLEAYRRFAPQLAEIVDRFFARGWIDAALRPGKDAGAFCHPTVPSVHPYVLMNYQGRPRDVMTLAHELGHGVHQTLAAEQGPLMAGTPLTLAETASVFGEQLTFRALLEAETDPVQRRIMLAGKIEDGLNTVVRQIAFVDFEQRVHEARQQSELTADELGELWLQVQTESLGPAFHFEESYRVFWSYIPHFIHVPFYVYAYAFGDCLVNSLYAVYQAEPEGFEARYLELLRAGGTLRHRELLAPFGLDATDPDFWAKGLAVVETHDRSAGRGAGYLTMAEGPVRRPENTLSGRVWRYARVSGTVGGLAARMAGQRFLGIEIDRPQHAEELRAALGGLKGPLMKVAQLLATIPEALPKEYAAELAQLQSAGAAHGRTVRAPPHGGRARARLARQVQGIRARGRGRRLARPGPPRARARRPGAGVQAAISGHRERGRGRPDAAEADLQPLSPLRPHDQSGAHLRGAGRAPARGARLRARSQAHGTLRRHAAGRGRRARARGAGASSRPGAC